MTITKTKTEADGIVIIETRYNGELVSVESFNKLDAEFLEIEQREYWGAIYGKSTN